MDNVLGSSTNPTLPYGATATAEHDEMIRTVHRLHPRLATDCGGARPHPRRDDGRRVRAARPWRDRHHHLRRAGYGPDRRDGPAHLATRAPDEGGPEGDGERNDNERVLRYIAKLTINPAVAHGIAHDVGSLEPGKLADIVLWRPAFFGAKPQLVIKGGFGAWGPLGSGSGSTRLGEPLVYNAQFGGVGGRAGGAFDHLHERGRSRAGGRTLAGPSRGRPRMPRPQEVGHGTQRRPAGVHVDPLACRVLVDGLPVELEPAQQLPLNRAYFLT